MQEAPGVAVEHTHTEAVTEEVEHTEVHYTTRVAARKELSEELFRILAPRKLAFELVAHTTHIELALFSLKFQKPSSIEIYCQRMGALVARKLGFKPVLDKRADRILTLEKIHLFVVCRTCQADLYFENGHFCVG